MTPVAIRRSASTLARQDHRRARRRLAQPRERHGPVPQVVDHAIGVHHLVADEFPDGGARHGGMEAGADEDRDALGGHLGLAHRPEDRHEHLAVRARAGGVADDDDHVEGVPLAAPLGRCGRGGAGADALGQHLREGRPADGALEGLGHRLLGLGQDRRPVGLHDGHEVLVGHLDAGARAPIGQLDLHDGIKHARGGEGNKQRHCGFRIADCGMEGQGPRQAAFSGEPQATAFSETGTGTRTATNNGGNREPATGVEYGLRQ